MRKILLTICILFVCANMTFGQVKISTSDLIGTKWQLEDAEDGHSKPFYEFTPQIVLWHCSDGTIFSYPFYLSATIPTTFDFSKVGVQTEGCYFIRYNTKRNCFYCYAIMSFSKPTGKMVHKRVYPTNIIGLTDTFTYTLMK